MIKKGYISDSYKFSMGKYTESDVYNVYRTYENSFYNTSKCELSYIHKKNRDDISNLYSYYYSKEFLLTPNKERMFEDVDIGKVKSDLLVNDTPKQQQGVNGGKWIINGNLIVNDTPKTAPPSVETRILAQDKRIEKIIENIVHDKNAYSKF
jgi:hypothetical protein